VIPVDLNSLWHAGKRDVMVDQTHRFPVVLEPEAEGGFTVRVPSLPEIVTYGEDEAEALSMADDAIRLVLEDCSMQPNGCCAILKT
jgi:predicted RNase H-like HicB family nuclease